MLIKALKKLKDLGNTIILVEHDPLTIKNADYIYDFGPEAGEKGGEIVAKGTFSEIIKNKNSLTGKYLSGKLQVSTFKSNRKLTDYISIKNANLHNLKNINVNIYKNAITTITGVSGSGKSTLVNDILKKGLSLAIKQKKDSVDLGFAKIENIKNIQSVVLLDQNLINPNVRSDVSTYTEIMPILRTFFASLKLAKTKGLKPRYFSYNHKKGMCKTCLGLGYQLIDLQYLPPVKITCESCRGYKLNPVSLSITYQDKNLGEILDLSIEKSYSFFINIPKIKKKLETLISLGLGYLKLGQPLNTLSGGEAQRIRLAKELSRKK